MRPKLFISHASAEDALAKRVIEALRDRAGGTFDILFDAKKLEGGDEWRPELWRWWSECDVAVVVCSEAAVQSRWMLIEVAVLMRRRFVNPNFPILPLIIDPATPDLVKQGMFGDQQLTELQAISVSAADFDAKIATIEARLQPFQMLDRRGKPVVGWEDRLAAILEDTRSPEVLFDVAAHLGVAADKWLGIALQSRIVARALLEHPDRQKIVEAVKTLRPRIEEQIRPFVELLAPAWLTLDEVAQISSVVDRPRGSRGIALESAWPPFAQWCVQRAAARYPLRKAIKPNPATTGDPKQVAADIVATVLDELNIGFGADEDSIERLMVAREKERDPIFALLPLSTKPPAIDPEMLPEIIEHVNAQLAGVAFFVLAGRPAIEVETPTHGKVVLIAHDIAKEKDLTVDYSTALS